LESVQTEEQEHQCRTAAIRDKIIRGQQEDREREAAIAKGRALEERVKKHEDKKDKQ
jgi:hypothetical protein